MSNDYQITLSSGEIYVLAGLLQYNSVMGIENVTLHAWQSDLARHIRNTVSRLERKKLILCELNGKLLIDSRLHRIMECICEPNNVCILSGNLKSGKDSAMYVLEKGGEFMKISKLDEDTYKLVYYSEYNLGTVLTGYFQDIKKFELREKMLLEDAKYAQSMIQAFQTDKAAAYIRKCVSSDGAAQKLYRLLSKMDGFIEIQLLKKQKSFYETIMCEIISVADGYAISMELDENDILTFSHLDPQILEMESMSCFQGLQGGI